MKKALALALLLVLPSAHAEIKKWVDKDGKVYYGEQPPVGVKTQTMNIKNPPPAPAAKGEGKSAPLTRQEKEAEEKKRQKADEEAKKLADEKASQEQIKKENCEQAKTKLMSLRDGGRQVRYNVKGEKEFLDDAAIVQETAKAEKDVAQWCK